MTGPQRFVVTVDGTDHDVIVDTDARGVTRTIVDGKALEVVCGPAGAVVVASTESAASTTVHLPPGPRPDAAHAGGRVYAVRTRTRREAALETAAAQRGLGAGEGSRVVSPMPGRVVRVLVEEGQSVAAQATLVIVEAMKMENEVRAVAPATVGRILVAAGDTVEAGQLMCELTPTDATD